MRTVEPLDFASDADVQRWESYIAARPDSQYSDLAGWRRLFLELYGLRNVSFACVDGGRTVGVASLYLLASPFFGRLLVTCPFFGSGGLYADDAAAEEALLGQVARAAEALRADFIELRLRRPVGAPYRDSREFLDFDLELKGTADDVWAGALSSNARQNVRAAGKHGLAFSTDGEAGETWGLLSATLRDLGTPFHGRRFFDLLPKHLGGAVRFAQVRMAGRLVAAGVLVRFRDRLATPYIGSLKRFRHTRANYGQYWGIIRHGLATGARWLELGRSPRGSSHQQFKEKWGAAPVELHYGHRALTARRRYRTVLDASPLERAASAAWKRLPLVLARRVGPWLARHIP